MANYGGYEVNFVAPDNLVPPTEWDLCYTREEVRTATLLEWAGHVNDIKRSIDDIVARTRQVIRRPSSTLVEFAEKSRELRRQLVADVGNAMLVNMGFEKVEPGTGLEVLANAEAAAGPEFEVPPFKMSEQLAAATEAVLACTFCKSGSIASPKKCGPDVAAAHRSFLAKQLGMTYVPPTPPAIEPSS